MLTVAEENYLKTIFKLASPQGSKQTFVNTNAIAANLATKAASVTDMLKKLADKNLIIYQRYKGVQLTQYGNILAKNLLRKHRLWELFLVEKLAFSWDTVHEIAEQLEHIQSEELVKRLDVFLGHPKFDPHGDPIPDEAGNFSPEHPPRILLSQLQVGQVATVVGVIEHHPDFFRYLTEHALILGATVAVTETHPFDQSLDIIINQYQQLTISQLTSQAIYVCLT